MRNIRERTHGNWTHEWALFTILQEAGRTDLDDQMIYKRERVPKAFNGGPVGNQMIWLVVPANWFLLICSFSNSLVCIADTIPEMKQNEITNKMCYTKSLFLDDGYFENVCCILELFSAFWRDWLIYRSCKNNTLTKTHQCFTNETSILKHQL